MQPSDAPTVVGSNVAMPTRVESEIRFSGAEGRQSITRERFVSLTVRYERRVRLFVSSLHPTASDVDEILQDAWLVAWKKLDSFSYGEEQPDEEFVRWLCTIARYEVAKYRRRHSKEPLLDDAVIEKLAALQFEEAEYFEARHDALLECIEKLRSRDRELIRRRYQGGSSAQDLATWLGRSVDAVYKSLNRIRKSLLACAKRTLDREGYF
jgi:RNA polymerase sigma-70 factor, ECF subfamily